MTDACATAAAKVLQEVFYLSDDTGRDSLVMMYACVLPLRVRRMILSLRESLPERAAIGKAKSARAIEKRY